MVLQIGGSVVTTSENLIVFFVSLSVSKTAESDFVSGICNSSCWGE